MAQASEAPALDIALYAPESLRDPYANYRILREAAPVSYLPALGMHVLARYAEVRAALADAKLYVSGQGVAMNPRMNEALKGGLLCSDAPRHDMLRRIIERPLTPKALTAMRERIVTEAEAMAERVVARGRVDAAVEIAQHLPVTIVSDMVGLPEEGRERILAWAAANFDCLGPDNPRTEAAFPIVGEMVSYAFSQCVPGKLKPDGWADLIWQAADRGEIDIATCPYLMNDYMGPALDTTIFALTAAIWLFARHPEQWDMIRQTPALIPRAINEIIRIESPIQSFSRVVTRDHDMDGIAVPEGARVIVLYGSANRCERKWRDPERFDILREGSSEHLGFGFGEHQCVGNNLARMEMLAVLTALSKRVARFELEEAEWGLNNTLRGLRRCVVGLS